MDKSGLTMDREMRTLMAEGGLKDDGMMRDPVSGNEIPPGSMAEEVRDDIPAQLSEGEYVVPADVVKYFGVKFFEELRAEAKSGLSSMEQNGRIGGEPVPAGGPRQDMASVTGGLTQEEMAQLEAVMSSGDDSMMTMAQGGIVPQQYGMPIAQPQMSKGYNNGGLEQEMETIESYRTFNPEDYTLGYSFSGQDQITQAVVMLYGPNGEVVSLMLPRDQARYNELLAQGYTTEQESLKPGEEKDEKPEDNYGGLADGGQEGPFGGDKDGLEGLNDVNNDGKVDFGDTFLGDLLGLDGKVGVQGPGLKDSLNGARRGGKDKGKDTGGKGTPSPSPTGPTSTGPTSTGPSAGGVASDTADDGTVGDIGAIGGGGTPAGPTAGGVAADTADEGTVGDIGAIGGGGIGDGEGPSGGTSGGSGTGGGGADSGQAANGGSSSGGDAGTGSDNDGDGFGDMGGISGGFTKGGLATKRTKAKRKPTNMNKGGLASPKSKK